MHLKGRVMYMLSVCSLKLQIPQVSADMLSLEHMEAPGFGALQSVRLQLKLQGTSTSSNVSPSFFNYLSLVNVLNNICP